MTSSNENITCSNCKEYGVWDQDRLQVPCGNCAGENQYMWNGRRCLGVGIFAEKREQTAREFAEFLKMIIEPRFDMNNAEERDKFKEYMSSVPYDVKRIAVNWYNLSEC